MAFNKSYVGNLLSNSKMKFVTVTEHYRFMDSTQLAQTCLVTRPIASLVIIYGYATYKICFQKKGDIFNAYGKLFPYVKHKCSWTCSQRFWKQSKCYEESVFLASQ